MKASIDEILNYHLLHLSEIDKNQHSTYSIGIEIGFRETVRMKKWLAKAISSETK